MVRVHVRHDHAQYGQALQLGLENLLPLRTALGPVNAAVHHRPAFQVGALAAGIGQAVAQQPQVDMVQRKRQHHAYPVHTGGNL
jgi:hypothetical protein